MDKISPEKDSMALPMDKIIGLVRELRNAIITGLLIDENLLAYFKHRYSRGLSNVKKEFLKRDLKELLVSPVDLVHYSTLIKEIRDNNRANLACKNEDLFYAELESVFSKYYY